MWRRYTTYIQHNIVMHLHNHCCHRKAVSSPSIVALQVAIHNIIWNTLPCKCNSESSLYGWATMPTLFISVINQLDAQNFCFTISLFHASTCFEAHVLIIRRSKLYYRRLCNAILTSWWWTRALETCRGMKYTYCKTKTLCIKLVSYWDKYTEMQGQQNVKSQRCVYGEFMFPATTKYTWVFT